MGEKFFSFHQTSISTYRILTAINYYYKSVRVLLHWPTKKYKINFCGKINLESLAIGKKVVIVKMPNISTPVEIIELPPIIRFSFFIFFFCFWENDGHMSEMDIYKRQIQFLNYKYSFITIGRSSSSRIILYKTAVKSNFYFIFKSNTLLLPITFVQVYGVLFINRYI